MSERTGDEGLGHKRARAQSNERAKLRRRELRINPIYTRQQFKKAVFDALLKKKDAQLDNLARVVAEPFPHCILPDFLDGKEDSLAWLENVIRNLEFSDRHNDLYKMSQSQDFKGITSSNIRPIKNFIYEEFYTWISEATGCNLNEDVDISSARYGINDFLLCHNDQFENRKVAFIYYLVDADWKEQDGGLFELFNTEHGMPNSVVSSVVPEKNMMLFFEVTAYSFHQVSEILTDKTRFTISGWYHSEIEELDQMPVASLVPSYPITRSFEVEEFIDPLYLDCGTMKEICSQFQRDSQILLYSFLKEDVHEAVAIELDESESWTVVGPPDLRSYMEIKIPDLPPVTRRVFNFLHSEVYQIFLGSLIGAFNFGEPIASSSSSSTSQERGASYTAQVTKFSHRSYSLLNSAQADLVESCLSSNLFINCSEWEERYGGCVSFIAKPDGNETEKEALVDIAPIENSLSLVFHGKDVSQYTRYINNNINVRTKPYYHRFSTIFYENQRSTVEHCGNKNKKHSNQQSS